MTWSMAIFSPMSLTAFVFSGKCGKETTGVSSSSAIVTTLQYAASASASTGSYAFLTRPSTYAFVTSSNGKIPALAPASIAIFEIVRRSVIVSSATPSPANSSERYSAPSTPMRPMSVRMTSLPQMFSGFLPVRTTLIASGTLNQASPVAIAAPRSVEPTPVAKPLTAP